jgi:predicted LPLAT superfamily acyltransferase
MSLFNIKLDLCMIYTLRYNGRRVRQLVIAQAFKIFQMTQGASKRHKIKLLDRLGWRRSKTTYLYMGRTRHFHVVSDVLDLNFFSIAIIRFNVVLKNNFNK